MGAATLHVWGETVDGAIFPLAAETDITKRLSTDPDEGNALLPLRTVGQGVGAAFTRLLFMMTTVDGDDPFVNADTGTNDAINLTVRNSAVFRSSISTSRTLPSTNKNPGSKHVLRNRLAPFTRNDLSRISLSIAGEDAWRPDSIFIFGLDGPAQSTERPTFLAPLVHLPNWPFSDLSTNTNEGQPTIQLPLVNSPNVWLPARIQGTQGIGPDEGTQDLDYGRVVRREIPGQTFQNRYRPSARRSRGKPTGFRAHFLLREGRWRDAKHAVR